MSVWVCPVCRYAAQAVHEEYVFTEKPFEGSLEELVMVRTGGETRIDVRWITGHNDAYAYHISKYFFPILLYVYTKVAESNCIQK